MERILRATWMWGVRSRFFGLHTLPKCVHQIHYVGGRTLFGFSWRGVAHLAVPMRSSLGMGHHSGIFWLYHRGPERYCRLGGPYLSTRYIERFVRRPELPPLRK